MKPVLIGINILDVSIGKTIKLSVQKVQPRKRRIISAEKYLSGSDKLVYVIIKFDSHSDTTFTGANCCILQYTGK